MKDGLQLDLVVRLKPLWLDPWRSLWTVKDLPTTFLRRHHCLLTHGFDYNGGLERSASASSARTVLASTDTLCSSTASDPFVSLDGWTTTQWRDCQLYWRCTTHKGCESGRVSLIVIYQPYWKISISTLDHYHYPA